MDNLKESLLGFVFLVSYISIPVAMITHIGVSFVAKEWGFLAVGIVIPPIGWVHGVGAWFGAWS